jgi:hypothetical protein
MGEGSEGMASRSENNGLGSHEAHYVAVRTTKGCDGAAGEMEEGEGRKESRIGRNKSPIRSKLNKLVETWALLLRLQ